MTLKSELKLEGFRPTRDSRKRFDKWFKDHKARHTWVTKDAILNEAYYQVHSGKLKLPWGE